ncbi:MAG: hypothetical protein ABWW70_06325 [Thermoproteota archaeon]
MEPIHTVRGEILVATPEGLERCMEALKSELCSASVCAHHKALAWIASARGSCFTLASASIKQPLQLTPPLGPPTHSIRVVIRCTEPTEAIRLIEALMRAAESCGAAFMIGDQ